MTGSSHVIVVFAEHAKRPEYRRLFEDSPHQVLFVSPQAPFPADSQADLAILDTPPEDPQERLRILDAFAARGVPIVYRFTDPGRSWDFSSWIADAYVPPTEEIQAVQLVVQDLLGQT